MRKLKELFSDTLIYGISSVFARFINYLLVPFYLDKFPPDEYGVVGLVYAAIMFLNVVFTMGMESSYIRYGKDREKAPGYFKTIQVFLFGVSIVLATLLAVGQPWFSSLLKLGASSTDIYWYMLGILFFDTLSIVPFAELRINQKAWLFAALRTLNVFINLGLNFYLILSEGLGIEAIFISNFAASVVTAILSWMFTGSMLRGAFDKEFVHKAATFGLPFIPAGIGFAINEGLDRFFLGGLSEERIFSIYGINENAEFIVGVYNANYKLAVFMLLLVQMFRMAWQPFFMRKSEDKEAPQLYAQVFTYFNIVAAVLFLFVGLFLDQLVAIRIPFLDAYLINPNYWMGLSIVPVLLLAYWFQGWYVNFSAGIFISEMTKKLAQITLTGALVTIISNFALMPFFGMMGSAVATVCSYLVMAMLIFRYSIRYFPVPYNLFRSFSVVALSIFIVTIKPVLSKLFFPDIIAAILLMLVGTFVIVLISISRVKAIKK